MAGGVIQSKTGSTDPDLAKSIREVLDDSVRFIREHEPEARGSLERHLGVSPDVAQHAAIDRFVTVEEIDWPGAQKVADLMREQGMFNTRVKAKGMLP